MKTKLEIFKEVAHHQSFTKASEVLFISQPAVSKAIKLLEEEYKTSFFIRKRNSIELTEEGTVFLDYANKILKLFGELENRFLSLEDTAPAEIQFGVSTTLANYILPKVIAKFRLRSPQTNFVMKSGNSSQIEAYILDQQMDFGITEGGNTNRKLHYEKFTKDEIVLVTNAQNNQIKTGTVSKEQLVELPYIEREMGSGTRSVIYKLLKKHQISSLNTVVTLSSTEAIKNYLYYSNNYALVSINAIQEDLVQHRLKIIDIKNVELERWFYFVCRTGYQSKIMDYFFKLVRANYNQ